MLDPRIDGHTRVGRVLSYRREALNQQLRCIQATGEGEDLIRTINLQIREINTAASRLGASKGKSGIRGRRGRSVKMPESTHLVEKMLDEEGTYRILSAVVHGHEWAIRQLGFTEPVALPSSSASARIYMARVGKTLRPETVVWLGLTAARAFCVPVWRQFTYEGWDRKPLRELFDASFDRLRATETIRFWR